MKTYTQEELNKIIETHRQWLIDFEVSKRADLSGANLSNTNLHQTDLSGANLSNTNLHQTDLSGANLSGANLRSANLSYANLIDANLIDTT